MLFTSTTVLTTSRWFLFTLYSKLGLFNYTSSPPTNHWLPQSELHLKSLPNSCTLFISISSRLLSLLYLTGVSYQPLTFSVPFFPLPPSPPVFILPPVSSYSSCVSHVFLVNCPSFTCSYSIYPCQLIVVHHRYVLLTA